MSERTPKPPEDEFQRLLEAARSEYDYEICGAWASTSGKVCTQKPKKGRDRCKFHGGDTPRGIECVNFKHGRYSKTLPDAVASRYRQLLNDPDILALQEDAALLTLRLEEVIEGAFQGRSSTAWDDLKTAFEEMRYYAREGKKDKMMAAIDKIEGIIRAGNRQAEAWNEAREIIDLRRKLSRDEWKRRKDQEQMLTAEEAYTLGRALLDAVKKHVPDKDTRRKIGNEIRGILS